MKLTTEMKKYIRHAVAEKAKVEIAKLKDEVKNITSKNDEKIKLVYAEADRMAREMDEKLKEFAKRHGLTFCDFDIFSVYHRGDDAFTETLASIEYTNDGRRIEYHKNNPKLDELENEIRRINDKIDSECGRLFFNIEVGKERKDIEGLIAGIDFSK